jgi:hypothetical protein
MHTPSMLRELPRVQVSAPCRQRTAIFAAYSFLSRRSILQLHGNHGVVGSFTSRLAMYEYWMSFFKQHLMN